jgi:ribose-phosphate pyrophosphokinase
MDFDKIYVREPHSDVTPALLDCSTSEWCADKIGDALFNCGAESIFFPDAGAAKRYSEFKFPHAVGHKSRDFKTGNIQSFDLIGEIAEKVLIVDDMCSRGGTFVHSAKLLKEKGAKEVYLMVAYCENTVFEGELFDYVEKLYISKDNVMSQTNEKIVMI